MKKSLYIILILIGAVSMVSAEMRIWTSVKGDTIEAEYVKILAGKVMLKRAGDGKILKVPASGLCKKDRDFLADLIPPKIEVDVDTDKDTKKIHEYYSYTEKRETISATIELIQKNKEKCNRKMVCHFYVIGRHLREDVAFIMAYDKHKFDFLKSKKASFSNTPSSAEFAEGYGYDKNGTRYEGYLVYVEDTDGSIIMVKATKGAYESHLSQIKGSKKGKKFTW